MGAVKDGADRGRFEHVPGRYGSIPNGEITVNCVVPPPMELPVWGPVGPAKSVMAPKGGKWTPEWCNR